MNFKDLAEKVRGRFLELSRTEELYQTSTSGELLWKAYIEAFRPGDDPVFRDPESSTHTSNLDMKFIQRDTGMWCRYQRIIQ